MCPVRSVTYVSGGSWRSQISPTPRGDDATSWSLSRRPSSGGRATHRFVAQAFSLCPSPAAAPPPRLIVFYSIVRTNRNGANGCIISQLEFSIRVSRRVECGVFSSLLANFWTVRISR
jgi:hypothetical protein